MGVPGRLLSFLLAFVPLLWGMCPCRWFAQEGQHAAVCCPEEEDDACLGDRSTDGVPPKPPPPCKGCAFMDAGRGVVAPSHAPMPAPPGLDWAFAIEGSHVAPRPDPLAVLSRCVRHGSGPPPAASIGTVLLI